MTSSISIIVITTLLLFNTYETKHRRKAKHFDDTQLKKIAKRYDDMQYDPGNMPMYPQQRIYSSPIDVMSPVSIQKSNIPFAPESENNFQSPDQQTEDIPLGPLVQADNRPDGTEGDVHLKDLLTFIRKTNIPEDPFSTSDSTSSLAPPQSPSFEDHGGDFFPQTKRFDVPQGRRRMLYNSYGQQDTFRDAQGMYVRKNIIPSLPKQVKKSEDPLEGLKQGIARKAKEANIGMTSRLNFYKKSSIPRTNKIALYPAARSVISKTASRIPPVIQSRYSNVPKRDPYDALHRAITTKVRRENVPQKQKDGIEEVSSAIYPNTKEGTKKMDIPGITVEHTPNKFEINEVLMMSKSDELRRNIIPYSNSSSASIIRDANNEEETKRSSIPVPLHQRQITYARYNIPNLVNAVSGQTTPHFVNTGYQNTQQWNIPASTTDAVYPAASQQNNEKKEEIQRSFIPLLTKPFIDSSPVVLRQYPAESMYRKSSSDPGLALKKSLIDGANPGFKTAYATPVNYKKSEIPSAFESTALTEKAYDESSYEAKKSMIVDPGEEESDINHVNATSNAENANNVDSLPSGDDMEKTKVQREMHLINQLNGMKKSTIPHPYDMISTFTPQQDGEAKNDNTYTNYNQIRKSEIPKPKQNSLQQSNQAVKSTITQTMQYEVPQNIMQAANLATQTYLNIPAMPQNVNSATAAGVIPPQDATINTVPNQLIISEGVSKKSAIPHPAVFSTQSEEKKSSIPHAAVVTDSTPLVLHVHPAESTARQNIALPQSDAHQLVVNEDDLKKSSVPKTATNTAKDNTFMQTKEYASFQQYPVMTYENMQQENMKYQAMVNADKKSGIPNMKDTVNSDNHIIEVSSNQVQLPSISTGESDDKKQSMTAEKKDHIPLIRDSFPLRLRKYPPS